MSDIEIEASKDRFDLALQPDLRARLAESYEKFLSRENVWLQQASGALSPRLRERQACPLCGSHKRRFLFSCHGLTHVRCIRCGFAYTLHVAEEAAEHAYYRQDEAAQLRLLLVTHPAWQTLEKERARYIFAQLRRHGAHRRHLLDIGAGAGALLAAAREAGFSATGIEINEAYRERHRLLGLKVHYGAFPSDFPPTRLGRYDAITLLDVLEHIADPVSFLSATTGYLNEGGAIAVQVPNFNSLLLQIEGPANHNFCPGHWNHFTPKTLARAAHAAGLRPLLLDTHITELHRILAHPWARVANAFFKLTGKRLAAPEELTPEKLYRHHLGYKVFAILGRAT